MVQLLRQQRTPFHHQVAVKAERSNAPCARPRQEAVAKAQQGAALPLRILDFLRMEAGEGVHKEVKNFAEEVASQLKK